MAWATSLFLPPLGDLFLKCLDFFILVTKNFFQFNKTFENVSNLKHISTIHSVILLACTRPGQVLNYLVELGHNSHCYFPDFFFFFLAFTFSGDEALHVQIPLSGIHEASSLSLMQICNKTQVASIQTWVAASHGGKLAACAGEELVLTASNSVAISKWLSRFS